MKRRILIFVLLFPVFCFSQQTKTDSLLYELRTAKEDSSGINILNSLGWEKTKTDKDSAMVYANRALALAKKINFRKGISRAYRTLGIISCYRFNYSEAIITFSTALKTSEDIKDNDGITTSLSYLANAYRDMGDNSKALEFYFKALKLSDALGNKKKVASSLGNIGNTYYHTGDYYKGIEYFKKALIEFEKLGDKKQVASCLGSLGNVYNEQCDYPKALDYCFRALKINEDLKNKSGISMWLGSIGNIYRSQKEYTKALDCFFKALKIDEELGEKNGIGNWLGNIGVIYYEQDDFPKALVYYLKALKMAEEIDDKKGISHDLTNIAGVYYIQKDYSKALETYFKALKIGESLDDKYTIATTLGGIGMCYSAMAEKQTSQKLRLANYKESEKHLLHSLELAEEMHALDKIKTDRKALSKVYSALGLHQRALENYIKYEEAKDSVFNDENTKKTVQAEMNFEFTKKEEAAKADQDKKDLLAWEEKQRQAVIRNAFIGGFALVLILALVVLRSYKQKQFANKQLEEKNILIAEQKYLVEEKHREITDSINYAERIQRSFLAAKQLLDENLKEHFVFFQPKDIVSGDFYWASKLSNNNFALVTADSTGHGVPGAIMSILNISSLEKSVEEKKLTDPAEILNHTRKKIIERLKRDGSSEGGKDGMDCSLISFDFTKKHLQIANANNPVWIARNGEIIEIKADKMPVGKHDKDKVPFTLKTFDILPGDMVYAVTDGFQDQFGGEKGKKFMTKNLKYLLSTNAHLPMNEQKQLLRTTFINWCGNLEQVDDVTIIGVRV